MGIWKISKCLEKLNNQKFKYKLLYINPTLSEQQQNYTTQCKEENY